MKLFKRIFLAAVALVSVCSTASGVTKEEFEQARTIAAIWYLRYANDGSGYLEELSPKNLQELESKLKTKEKENIKGFKAVALPSDYASWDKNKLVDYWSNTFFASPGIPAEAKRAKMRVSRKIAAMEISAPAPQNTEENARTAKHDTIVSPVQTQAEVAQQAEPETKTAVNSAPDTEDDTTDKKKSKDDSTMFYVIVLIVMVAIVVALVVYAMNSMKKNRHSGNDPDSGSEELEKLRNSFAERLSQKNEEIEDMRKTIEALTRKIQLLESEAAKNTARYTERKVSASTPRIIYLSRANSKGIFLRADSKFSLGNSIFRLVTTNGVSGTFSIIDDPTVHEMALMMPQDFLINACDGKNLQLAQGMQDIITDEPGTAIFEDGKWRIARKARIHYTA